MADGLKVGHIKDGGTIFEVTNKNSTPNKIVITSTMVARMNRWTGDIPRK